MLGLALHVGVGAVFGAACAGLAFLMSDWRGGFRHLALYVGVGAACAHERRKIVAKTFKSMGMCTNLVTWPCLRHGLWDQEAWSFGGLRMISEALEAWQAQCFHYF